MTIGTMQNWSTSYGSPAFIEANFWNHNHTYAFFMWLIVICFSSNINLLDNKIDFIVHTINTFMCIRYVYICVWLCVHVFQNHTSYAHKNFQDCICGCPCVRTLKCLLQTVTAINLATWAFSHVKFKEEIYSENFFWWVLCDQ